MKPTGGLGGIGGWPPVSTWISPPSLQSIGPHCMQSLHEVRKFVRPLYYQGNPLLLLVQTTYCIIVPIQSSCCYYYALQKPTIAIVVPLQYYCYVRFDIGPLRLLSIERRSRHLYHQRIVHLCNVKEVAPWKRLILKSWIQVFYLYVSQFHNISLTEKFLTWDVLIKGGQFGPNKFLL